MSRIKEFSPFKKVGSVIYPKVATDTLAAIVAPWYGVSWDESADTYVRTGALTGVAVGSSPGNTLLPIQAAMRRCVINDSGVVQYYLDPANSTLKVGGGAAVLTGADGQVMVETPAFYYRYAYSGTTHTWEISQVPLAGFSLHPAFIKNNTFVPYRYEGAYEGVLYDVTAAHYANGLYLPSTATYTLSFADNGVADDTITSDILTNAFTLLAVGEKIVVTNSAVNDGTYTIKSVTDTVITLETGSLAGTTANDQCELATEKDWTATTGDVLASISGKAPINQVTIIDFRTLALNRGSGWRQTDYDLMSAIQLLYLIEYASFYSQSMIGKGSTDWISASWNLYNNANPINNTGLSNSNGNNTENLSNGNGVVGSYMTYRGIENFYGHMWTYIDGINVNNNVPYVTNTQPFLHDTTTNYTNLGITLSSSNGWQNTLAQQDRGFLPLTVGASGTTKITDNYTQSTGWRACRLGGGVVAGNYAGIFYIGTSSDAALEINRSYSSRIAF